MKVAAVMTVKNEADIIGVNLTHLYASGVSNIYIADGCSSDGTRDILAGFPCKVFDDDSPYHRQPYWSTRLALQAHQDGCDWVLPVDADEFWVTSDGRSIPECLADFPGPVGRVPMRQHIDYDYREPDWKPLPKVVFRASPNVYVANGNHAVTGLGSPRSGCGLAIREIQYRGFNHFVRKIEERNATIDPSLPSSEGAHHRRFAGWSREELERVWRSMVDGASVLDPIPLRR